MVGSGSLRKWSRPAGGDPGELGDQALVLDFSVVIPTYNRPDSLKECLHSLYRSDFPREKFEIVVVDDGSSESYQKVREAFPDLVWLRTENGGPALARNQGVLQAGGKYIAFTDDDCYAASDWLSKLKESFLAAPEAIVGGSTPAYQGANFFDQVCQFICSLVYSHYNGDANKSGFFAGNNLALSRKSFDDLGGFNAVHTKYASEDRTLCNHALSAGYQLIWNQKAIVYHHPRLSFPRFCRMFFRYGRGAYTYQRARLTGTLARDTHFHLHLPKKVWKHLKEEPSLPKIPTLLLLIVWQFCNLFGFLYQATQGEQF